MPRSGARILVFLIVAVVAGFLAWLGHDPLRHPGAGEPVFWPLAGFGAVALVYLSPKLWPSVVIGLVTGTLAWWSGSPRPRSTSPDWQPACARACWSRSCCAGSDLAARSRNG